MAKTKKKMTFEVGIQRIYSFFEGKPTLAWEIPADLVTAWAGLSA